jgi:hypothetical protein
MKLKLKMSLKQDRANIYQIKLQPSLISLDYHFKREGNNKKMTRREKHKILNLL